MRVVCISGGPGRVDLNAVDRPHLSDPCFVMHESAKIGYAEQTCPKPYYSARTRYMNNLARAQLASAPAGMD